MKKDIKNILVITLSNIGDVVLTTPVLAALLRQFPEAGLDAALGKKAAGLFDEDPRIRHVFCYPDIPPGRNYDLIVNLRRRIFAFFLRKMHRVDFHLSKLAFIGLDARCSPYGLFVSEATRKRVDQMLLKGSEMTDFIVVAAGARSDTKRWTADGFARLCDRINDELSMKAVLVGEEADASFIEEIIRRTTGGVLNLCGKTTLQELIALIRRSRLVVSNDSAAVHIAEDQQTPVVALFGPTDPRKYGPRGDKSRLVKADLECMPCEEAQCKLRSRECMYSISAEDVFEACRRLVR